MARTVVGGLLTQQHRLAQLALRAAVLRDLAALWQVVDLQQLAATWEQFATAAAVVIQARHGTSAALAEAYLQQFRAAEGIGGRLELPPRPPLPLAVPTTSLRITGLSGLLNARRAGLGQQAALANGFVRVAGSSSSLVLAGGRGAILEGMRRDPEHPRWQRVTSSRPCAFCGMLASRGAAYRAESAATFQAHDHCSCTPEPAYSGSRLPPASEHLSEQWREATRGLSGTDALNAFRAVVGQRGGSNIRAE